AEPRDRSDRGAHQSAIDRRGAGRGHRTLAGALRARVQTGDARNAARVRPAQAPRTRAPAPPRRLLDRRCGVSLRLLRPGASVTRVQEEVRCHARRLCALAASLRAGPYKSTAGGFKTAITYSCNSDPAEGIA